MHCYQELTLIPSQEITPAFIWSKLYNQLHIGFATQKDAEGLIPIGVSFPEYQEGTKDSAPGLGVKLRLFADDRDILERLNPNRLLSRLADYVHITGIRPIPLKVKAYARYSRYHMENNPAAKAKRYAIRHNIAYEEALSLFPVCKNKCHYPYIIMRSTSTNQKFSLFITCSKTDKPTQGNFGTYGLSDTATVPLF